MNIHQRLQPRSLDDIVGQPQVRHLKALVAQPYASCWLLEGAPGTGKTATSQALAAELGCYDEFSGRWQVPCTELGIDEAKKMFRQTLRLRYGSESGFNILILEELEWLSPQTQRFLKDALDPLTRLPSNLIVVGTSNGAGNLDRALLQRFRLLAYGNGPTFAEACLGHLADMCNGSLPAGWQSWGSTEDGFSMRVAINAFAMNVAEYSLV